jgi:hypothetical protein
MPTATEANSLRSALEGLARSRQVRPDAWIADCPVTPHASPSLTWAYRADSTVVLACQEGCSTETIEAALDLGRRSGLLRETTGAGSLVRSSSGATVQPSSPSGVSTLDAVAEAIAEMGVAGEKRAVKLLYLAVTSRLLERPVSVVVKGPSAAGKSYLVECVLRLFPDSAYHALSAMSERALIYDETPLAHRMLVIFEAAGMAGDLQTYIMRSLLSEGRVRYETVERTKAGLRPRLIEREGPTGLITTTTAVRLHPENETRMLSVTLSDTAEQTRAVLMAYARGKPDGPDVTRWHELQERLESERPTVRVPFLRALAELIPPVSVRLRRDFPTLVSLVRAHALLAEGSRQADPAGAVVATVADYAIVRELIADLVADAADRSVAPSIRDTVRHVASLVAIDAETTVLSVAHALGIDKSSASRRVRSAIDHGYVKNLEDHRGRPARLVLADPLPADTEILPHPELVERLHGCSPVDEVAGGGAARGDGSRLDA